MKNDEVVQAAVQPNGQRFLYVSKDMKNDEKFVFAAIEQDGFALKHAAHGMTSHLLQILERMPLRSR